MTSSRNKKPTQNIRFNGWSSPSVHLLDLAPSPREPRECRLWGLTSGLAAHLVQTAAGADAAADDDEEGDGDGPNTNDHRQFRGVVVII